MKKHTNMQKVVNEQHNRVELLIKIHVPTALPQVNTSKKPTFFSRLCNVEFFSSNPIYDMLTHLQDQQK